MTKEKLGWMLKGAAMGAADAVPGVSGGTIALITGVYERFISALASFKLSLVPLIKQRHWRQLWAAIDGEFLFYLGIGIVISLFSVLNLLHLLLETAAPVVWAFFMGVIAVSLFNLSSERSWRKIDVLLFLVGLAISALLVFASFVNVGSSPLILITGGALAISAMLLPGISGSFILLLLGIYPQIVEAVHERDLLILVWVGLGCLIGMLSFSRFLQWLMAHWHQSVLSYMLGFIAGALIKVWPWQLSGQWLLPSDYAVISGTDAWLLVSLLVFGCGCLSAHFLHMRSGN